MLKTFFWQNPVLSSIVIETEETELLCIFKYGIDGTGSFSTYMQKDEMGHIPDGSTILASQLVPLKVKILVGHPTFIRPVTCPHLLIFQILQMKNFGF